MVILGLSGIHRLIRLHHQLLRGKAGALLRRDTARRRVHHIAAEPDAQPLRQSGDGHQGVAQIEQGLVPPGKTVVFPDQDAEDPQGDPAKDQNRCVVAQVPRLLS